MAKKDNISTAFEYQGQDKLYELLFALLRRNKDPFPPFKIVATQFPWREFLEVVRQERLSGFVYYELMQHEEKAALFPKWFCDELRQNFQRSIVRAEAFRRHYEEILQVFVQKKIPVLFMRSEAVQDVLYPSQGIRYLTDMDIIVRKDDFPLVQQILQELRYVHDEHTPHLLVRDGVEVDIHFDEASAWRIDFWPNDVGINSKDIWQHAVALLPAAPNVKKLWVYDEIIVGCGHLQEHSYRSLVWFMDIRQQILREGDRFDWLLLLQRAWFYELDQPLYFVLKFFDAQRLLVVPREILKTLDEARLNPLERLSLARLLRNQRQFISGELLYLFKIKALLERSLFLWRLAQLMRGEGVLPRQEIVRDFVLVQRWLGLVGTMFRHWMRVRYGR